MAACMSTLSHHNHPEHIRYIELCGLPGVGKTTLVAGVIAAGGRFKPRKPFFCTLNACTRFCLFGMLSLQYAVRFFYGMGLTFGAGVVFSKLFWRGYTDYLTVQYLVRHKNTSLLYDQGIVSLFLGLSETYVVKRKNVTRSLNVLLSTYTAIVYVKDTVDNVLARLQHRTALQGGVQNKKGCSVLDKFRRYQPVLDQLDAENGKLTSLYQTIDIGQADMEQSTKLLHNWLSKLL